MPNLIGSNINQISTNGMLGNLAFQDKAFVSVDKVGIGSTFVDSGTAGQNLQVQGGAYISDSVGIGITNPLTTLQVGAAGTNVFVATGIGSVGIGTTLPTDRLTVFGRVQIQQDSSSNNRIVLRSQPGSLYRWSIDNYSSANQFRIFREDDATAANGSIMFQLDAPGNALIAGITTVGLGSTSTPPNNSQMSFELTSNTNLRIKVKGTDGILRSANITLA